MKYRIQEIDLPEGDIYQHDALNRKPVVEFIEKFLAGLNGPFVLALDAPWGTGKTTVVRMLEATLNSKQVPCVYFNAWKVDYVSDPLVALVSALDQIKPINVSAGKRFKDRMATVRKLTTSVARHGAVAAVKAATFGALELESAIEKVASDVAGDLTKDLVESFQKERASLESLRTELEKAIAVLSEDAEAKPLVFFIDELDRCRPSFAIEMLERIKHLFDVEHLVFVLSVDKKQLEAATGAVYGEKIDSTEYLRRFFDIELRLPKPDSKRFAQTQIKRFGLDTYFAERGANNETRNDGDNLVETLGALIKVYDLSLRAIERIMARITLVCSQTPTNHFLDPILVAFLVVLRIKNIDLFEQLAANNVGSEAVMADVCAHPRGREFADSRLGIVLEAYLLTGDSDEKRKNSVLKKLKAATEAGAPASESKRANEVLEALNYVPPQNIRRYGFSVSSVASKVEMASTLGA